MLGYTVRRLRNDLALQFLKEWGKQGIWREAKRTLFCDSSRDLLVQVPLRLAQASKQLLHLFLGLPRTLIPAKEGVQWAGQLPQGIARRQGNASVEISLRDLSVDCHNFINLSLQHLFLLGMSARLGRDVMLQPGDLLGAVCSQESSFEVIHQDPHHARGNNMNLDQAGEDDGKTGFKEKCQGRIVWEEAQSHKAVGDVDGSHQKDPVDGKDGSREEFGEKEQIQDVFVVW